MTAREKENFPTYGVPEIVKEEYNGGKDVLYEAKKILKLIL